MNNAQAKARRSLVTYPVVHRDKFSRSTSDMAHMVGETQAERSPNAPDV
jgi:hypothetical protein